MGGRMRTKPLPRSFGLCLGAKCKERERKEEWKIMFSDLPFGLLASSFEGFPGGASGKEPTCQCRRHKRQGFDPWVGKIPWRRTWQSTPLFLPRESHGQRTHGMEPWTESTVYRAAKSWTRLKQLSTHATTSESCWFFSVQFSCSVVSDSLQPHGLQHARLPCPSPTPGAYSNSCPWSWWCHWFF